MEIIGVIVYLALCTGVGYFAEERGRSGLGWGLGAALISPLLCFILLLILKDLRKYH